MPTKVEIDGKEVEVYTADEVQAKTTEALTAKETEFGTVKTELETRLGEVTKALNERTGEFKQFRKLNDDQIAKLSIAEKTIYDNGVLLQEEREKGAARDKQIIDERVKNSIRAKAGTDEKLFTKMNEMWPIIGIEAITPEQIENKTLMILGALSTSQPDLVASVAGFSSGSYTPPSTKKEGEDSFADSERGAKAAAELGFITKLPEKK